MDPTVNMTPVCIVITSGTTNKGGEWKTFMCACGLSMFSYSLIFFSSLLEGVCVFHDCTLVGNVVLGPIRPSSLVLPTLVCLD